MSSSRCGSGGREQDVYCTLSPFLFTVCMLYRASTSISHKSLLRCVDPVLAVSISVRDWWRVPIQAVDASGDDQQSFVACVST